MQHLYPDLPFDLELFRFSLPRMFCFDSLIFITAITCVGNYWQDATNRKSFFLKFAEDAKIGDPLNSTTWYPVTADMIRKAKVLIVVRINLGLCLLEWKSCSSSLQRELFEGLSGCFPRNTF